MVSKSIKIQHLVKKAKKIARLSDVRLYSQLPRRINSKIIGALEIPDTLGAKTYREH